MYSTSSPLFRPSLHRRRWASVGAAGVLALACLLQLPAAQAQVVPAQSAVPFYTPGNFMQGAYRYAYAPQAAQFSRQAHALTKTLSALCAAPAAPNTAEPLQQARAQWLRTTTAWDGLAGVQIGPLLQRRSARQIDFSPTRPELIQRAITSMPADARAMERIGTPAKGLPALEWLLWSQPIAAQTPACDYAVQVAADVAREADALQQAFDALAALDLSEEEDRSVPAMSELVNQWVGSIERLRWAYIEKPRLVRQTGAHAATRAAAAYPRSASGQTAASWNAHWQAVRAVSAASSNVVPQPGFALLSLETYLRGRGLNRIANTLAAHVLTTDQAMRAAQPDNNASLVSATRALSALKQYIEAEVAPALNINIGFSDADGD